MTLLQLLTEFDQNTQGELARLRADNVLLRGKIEAGRDQIRAVEDRSYNDGKRFALQQVARILRLTDAPDDIDPAEVLQRLHVVAESAAGPRVLGDALPLDRRRAQLVAGCQGLRRLLALSGVAAPELVMELDRLQESLKQ